MAKLSSFEDIIAWQKARELNKVIYSITNNNTNFFKDYGLRDQLRRASVSIASNLAEGTSRQTNKDKAHYTTMAFSSLMEVLNQIIIAYELDLLKEEDYNEIRKEIEKISNKLNALKKAQLNS